MVILSGAAAVAGLGTVILTIFTEALTGRGQIITAMQLESGVIPFVMIVFLALALLLKISISARITIIAYVAGTLLTILLARWFWLRRGHPLLLDHSEKTNPIHLRYQDLAAFWGGGVVNVIANNIAFLALPFFAGPADIGRFGIAQRMATMSVTILDALSNIFMPAFARRYAHRDAAGLRHELIMSQVYSMLAYLPFVALFIFFAKPILGVVGEDFIAAQRFLMILMLGQLFNSATGLPGQLLNMIHRQDLAFYMNIAHLIVAAVLTYKLGSDYGALGVVIAVSISVVFKNLIFYIVARIHIHNSSKEWQPS